MAATRAGFFCVLLKLPNFLAKSNFSYDNLKPGNRAAYEDFLGDASLAVVTDPPFGGKVELVDRCIRSVTQDWRRVNGLRGELDRSPLVMWIFPYFMESKIRACNEDLRMSDYQGCCTQWFFSWFFSDMCVS